MSKTRLEKCLDEILNDLAKSYVETKQNQNKVRSCRTEIKEAKENISKLHRKRQTLKAKLFKLRVTMGKPGRYTPGEYMLEMKKRGRRYEKNNH